MVDGLEHGGTGGLDGLMNGSADQVFSPPVPVGEAVIIPAATVEFGRGFGFGRRPLGPEGRVGRPVAVIEAGPDGVRVKPVVDLPRVGFALAAAAFTVWRVTRR